MFYWKSSSINEFLVFQSYYEDVEGILVVVDKADDVRA